MPALPATSPSHALAWLRRELRQGEHAVFYAALRRFGWMTCTHHRHV